MARHSLLQSFVPGEGSQRVRTGLTAAQEENSELTPPARLSLCQGSPKSWAGRKRDSSEPICSTAALESKSCLWGLPQLHSAPARKGLNLPLSVS